jgi:hypothetical protein
MDLAESLSNVELLYPVSLFFFFRWDHWIFVLTLGSFFFLADTEGKTSKRRNSTPTLVGKFSVSICLV